MSKSHTQELWAEVEPEPTAPSPAGEGEGAARQRQPLWRPRRERKPVSTSGNGSRQPPALKELGPRILIGVAVTLFVVSLALLARGMIGGSQSAKALEIQEADERRLPLAGESSAEAPAIVEIPEGEEESETPDTGWYLAPGDFLTDVYTALEEGVQSELVQLSSEGMRIEFNRWSQSVNSPADLEGTMFVRLASEADGIQVYSFVNQRLGIDGLIKLESRDGRWYVVGVRGKAGQD